jgi:hypothetical protein
MSVGDSYWSLQDGIGFARTWVVTHPIAIGFERMCPEDSKKKRKYFVKINNCRLPVLPAI